MSDEQRIQIAQTMGWRVISEWVSTPFDGDEYSHEVWVLLAPHEATPDDIDDVMGRWENSEAAAWETLPDDDDTR